jgi:uncharacterized membrane protein YfhO
MAGGVRIGRYLPQQVELTATMQTPGLVVLSDTFYPGWDATVDDRPVPIVRANYFCRGVFVPAGEHRVVFRYRPMSYRVGARISFITCGLILIALVITRRR